MPCRCRRYFHQSHVRAQIDHGTGGNTDGRAGKRGCAGTRRYESKHRRGLVRERAQHARRGHARGRGDQCPVAAVGISTSPMFVPRSIMGLVEIPTGVPGSVDAQELGDMNPNIAAVWSVNVHSTHVAVTRAGGVTNALSLPSVFPPVPCSCPDRSWDWWKYRRACREAWMRRNSAI